MNKSIFAPSFLDHQLSLEHRMKSDRHSRFYTCKEPFCYNIPSLIFAPNTYFASQWKRKAWERCISHLNARRSPPGEPSVGDVTWGIVARAWT